MFMKPPLATASGQFTDRTMLQLPGEQGRQLFGCGNDIRRDVHGDLPHQCGRRGRLTHPVCDRAQRLSIPGAKSQVRAVATAQQHRRSLDVQIT